MSIYSFNISLYQTKLHSLMLLLSYYEISRNGFLSLGGGHSTSYMVIIFKFINKTNRQKKTFYVYKILTWHQCRRVHYKSLDVSKRIIILSIS